MKEYYKPTENPTFKTFHVRDLMQGMDETFSAFCNIGLPKKQSIATSNVIILTVMLRKLQSDNYIEQEQHYQGGGSLKIMESCNIASGRNED